MTIDQLEKAKKLVEEIGSLKDLRGIHDRKDFYMDFPEYRHDYYHDIGKCVYHLCQTDKDFDAKFFFLIDDTLSDRELEFSKL